MAPRHRHRTIPTSSLVISYLVSQSQAAFVNDFSAYPVNARSCMNTAAAASGCAGNTVTEMNTCLCGNGGNFVMATAKCVEKEAKDELDDVYEMLLTSCTDSKTPLAVSQAQFLDPEEEDDDDKASSTSSINGVSSISNSAGGSSSTTFATSITTPPNVATSARAQASITSTSMTTYESVAPGGVTITVTRGIEVVPTGTVSSGQQGSSGDTSTSGDDDGPGRGVLAAGIAGGFAVVIGALAFLCYRRRKQRKERKGQVGAGGKFASLSSATSLTTMTASPPQGQTATTAYHGANDLRPNTANSMQMAVGTAAWGRQQQQQQQQQQHQQQHYQHGPQSPQHWQQNNSPNQYGQPAGAWPSPVTNTDGTNGSWGVSPVSQYPTHASRGHESPPAQNATWNAHAVPAGGVPAPHPSHHPSNHTYAPVFELPGDETQAVEADSTPIGHAQPIRPPSRSIQSTPAHMSAHPAPAQPAAAHHGMPHRQIDDALQISQVELPPPRYSGPSSGSEWASEDKKFG
ncbi:hypothetical protein CH63R_00101 [Colletotrichum higginsianum IMI 349063]|uniref:Extracellular membrane protein CFEM domain-containing protein n=2 Tax=Colletotrichum higginsianum TaxID=80884 RepID=A0A1B7YSB9_COLHI|nr:hypothetical protein CH63R_00101 [Colletotrichum higginsianum IMI 349063]OBR14921.1 hypothetical protein CH63R_00101 [Colletotrichum higginsianum IMI 349063]TID04944.1 hypothetical protein CH35J_003229 [Colletotrichum higginsianum]